MAFDCQKILEVGDKGEAPAWSGVIVSSIVVMAKGGHKGADPNGLIAWELHLRRHHSAQLEGPGAQQS